jgi:phosphatidylglycerol:prolipoprotein diacylglycerol transferase
MFPIFGRYGPFFLYGYSVVLGLGLVVSLGFTAWLAQDKSRPGWLDGLLLSLLAGVAGGRFGYVLGQWEYFRERPAEIGDIWQGGLSYHGALLAGLLALALWCRWRKRPFYQDAALFAPALALLHVFAWLGCWLEGCAYGREVVLDGSLWLRWLATDLPDSFGVFGLRYRTQMGGMVLSLLLFLSVWWRYGRWPASSLFWLTLFALSTIHTLLHFGRSDVTGINLILNVALALLSLLLLQYSKRSYAFT